MRWSDQTIEQAIQTAKAKNAIFVVYVEDDTKPTSLHSFIESSDVSSLLMNERFVAIRICSSDQSYRDFVAIYQLVPIPSLFFIGNNGWPLEIISGELPQSAIVQRIKNLLGQPEQNIVSSPTDLQQLGIEPDDSTPTTSLTATTSTAAKFTSVPQESEKSEDVRKNVDRNSPDPQTSNSVSNVSRSTRSDSLNLPSHDDNAPNRISNQNIALHETISVTGGNDSSDVREKEQNKSVVQSSGRENKPSTHPSSSNVRKKPQPDPRREQEDPKSHLHISQERARHPLNVQQVSNVPRTPHPPITGFLTSIRGWMQNVLLAGRRSITNGPRTGRSLNERSSEPLGVPRGSSRIYEPSTRRLSGDPGFAHIQFRLPDGSTHSSSFPTETTIREVREYVQNNIPLPFRDFGLSTSYPRIEFTDEHIDATIAGLGLVPRSVILIIPGTETARPVLSSAADALWTIITWPFSAVFSIANYINFFLYGEPQTELSDQSSSQQQPRTSQLPTRNNPAERNQSNVRRRIPSSSVVQREGNVYRLSNRQDDSEDENNTWNGNSTQQM